MGIFESLENLNVSEECFDDILSIVEELLSEDLEDTAWRLHGNNPNKYREISNKIKNIQNDETINTAKREGRPLKDVLLRRNTNKNRTGENKTRMNRSFDDNKMLLKRIAREARDNTIQWANRAYDKNIKNVSGDPVTDNRVQRKLEKSKQRNAQ